MTSFDNMAYDFSMCFTNNNTMYLVDGQNETLCIYVTEGFNLQIVDQRP